MRMHTWCVSIVQRKRRGPARTVRDSARRRCSRCIANGASLGRDRWVKMKFDLRAGCAVRVHHVKETSTPNPSSEPRLRGQASPHGPESGPRRQALSHGPEAEALLDEVREAVGTLAKLLSHGRELGEPVTLAIRGALEDVSGRLDRRELRVVVVGQERSGKSTFLDALLGERLLGLAKTPPNIVTTIRSTPELGYRARLSDGFIDDFALRVPDRTARLTAEIESIEARLADAKGQSVAAAVEVAAAADALERVETAMTDAFRAFEAAREDAESLRRQARHRREGLGAAFDRRRGACERPAGCSSDSNRHGGRSGCGSFAFSRWLLYWRDWQRHHAVLLRLRKAETEVDELRAESSRAAERCWQAEAKLATANIPVEQARRDLETSRRAQHDAKQRAKPSITRRASDEVIACANVANARADSSPT